MGKKITKVLMALALRSQGHSQRCAGSHVGWHRRDTIFRCLVRNSKNRVIKPWETRPEEDRRLALEAVKDAKCVCKVSPNPEEQARQEARRKDAAKRGARRRADLKDAYVILRAIREGTGINFGRCYRYGDRLHANERGQHMTTSLTIEGSMATFDSGAMGLWSPISLNLGDPKFFEKVNSYYESRLAQFRVHRLLSACVPARA